MEASVSSRISHAEPPRLRGDADRAAPDPQAALAPIARTISRLARIKRKHGFDLDDLVILAACGAINFTGHRRDLPFAQPANIASIAEYIRVPRETVRRKLQTIEARGFVARYSGGYLVTSYKDWLALVGFLGSDAD